MNKKKREKQLQIVVFVLIAIITLGIGYTAISSIILTITGHARADVDEANFKVHFDRNVEPTMTVNMGSATIDQDNDKVAHISVTGLKKAGDFATAEYTIINESNGIGAKLSIDLVNTNTEHFKVTETLDDVELQAGDTTKVRILVELLETPTDTALETDITGTIEAKAIKNAEATSTAGASKMNPGPPESFETDSWKTIQTAVKNNNTSAYNVGDTKKVTINGTDYTVRIANKSVSQNCGSEGYSETACGFVVEFANVVTTMPMNSSRTVVGGYPASEVYSYLRNTLYGQLPNDLQSVIESTRVISGYGCTKSGQYGCENIDNNGENFVTNDKLYLLSGKEVYNIDNYDNAASSTRQLDYYIGMEKDIDGLYGNKAYSRALKGYGTINSVEYWFRTTDSRNGNITFLYSDYGNLSANMGPSSNYGVSPAFRIG